MATLTKTKVREFFKQLAPRSRLQWDQWDPECECSVFAKLRTRSDYDMVIEAQFAEAGIRIFGYLYPRTSSRVYPDPGPLKTFGGTDDDKILYTWAEFEDDADLCGYEARGALSSLICSFAEDMFLISEYF